MTSKRNKNLEWPVAELRTQLSQKEIALQQALQTLSLREAALSLASDRLQAEIAERQRAEEALRRLNDELRAAEKRASLLLHAVQTVSGSLELGQILEQIAHEMVAAVGVSHCAIYLVDREQAALVPRVIIGTLSASQADTLRTLRLDPSRTSLELYVLDHREPVVSPDAQSDPRANQEQAHLLGVKSILAAPIQLGEEVLGVATAYTPQETLTFTAEQVELAAGIANSVALAIRNAELYGEIQRRLAESETLASEHARLHEQAERLAVLQERQRLARELHDSVTQSLYSVTLYANAAALALAAGKQETTASYLQELQETAQEGMRDMRLLIFQLHPPELQTEGLVAVLQARLAAVEARAGLQTDFRVEGERRLPIAIEEELYWIAQEALNNVLKHAQAHHVSVRLHFTPTTISLEVRDDGVGFDPLAVRERGGVGLRSIAERAARVGGRLTHASKPGEGTQLRIEVTLPSKLGT